MSKKNASYPWPSFTLIGILICSLLTNFILLNRVYSGKHSIEKIKKNASINGNNDQIQLNFDMRKDKPFEMKNPLMCKYLSATMVNKNNTDHKLTFTTQKINNALFSLEFNLEKNSLVRSTDEGERLIETSHTILNEDDNTLIALRRHSFPPEDIEADITNYEYIYLSKKTGFGFIYNDDISKSGNATSAAYKISHLFQCE